MAQPTPGRTPAALPDRTEVAPGPATEKAIRHSLGGCTALIRYLDDGDLPMDNNWLEKRIRPVALDRSNWLFAGPDRAGRRAAVVMSLIQSARLHGLDPNANLHDVRERLPLTPQARSATWSLTPGNSADRRRTHRRRVARWDARKLTP
jgi:hypothetical protein